MTGTELGNPGQEATVLARRGWAKHLGRVKTFREIHDEIRAAQVTDVATIEGGGAKAAQLLPAWLFRPYFWLAIPIGHRFARVWKNSYRTVTVTAVGMAGKGAGWGIPPSSPSICWITVGGIGHKRQDAGGQAATRDYLNPTVSFDHNMVDAAPAARFTARLTELIESGYGLTLDKEAIAEPRNGSLARKRKEGS